MTESPKGGSTSRIGEWASVRFHLRHRTQTGGGRLVTSARHRPDLNHEATACFTAESATLAMIAIHLCVPSSICSDASAYCSDSSRHVGPPQRLIVNTTDRKGQVGQYTDSRRNTPTAHREFGSIAKLARLLCICTFRRSPTLVSNRV